MPKVYHVKARKDYPNFGIKKGDQHYTWTLKTGPRTSREFRQIAPPRRSQLTTSEFLSTVYDLEDRLASVDNEDDARSLVDELNQLADEQDDKLSNMPEGLKQGPTGQQIEARAEGCREAANEIESLLDNHADEDDWEDTMHQVREVVINYE
ncbi:hypothetical protein [Synechococcus phage Ssp-JY38]|nr:hypothetical protein [Synechococcus phage Yong-L2-223]